MSTPRTPLQTLHELIQYLIPVLRKLGLVTIFWDVYFGNAGKLFAPATGGITNPADSGRVKKFVDELVWMARALRFASENIRHCRRGR